MFSVRSVTGPALAALGVATLGLAGSSEYRFENYNGLETRAAKSCPATSQTSCQNTTAQADLCCFNYPGGALLQTQFWDTDPVTGPNNSWTIHGLWVSPCSSSQPLLPYPGRISRVRNADSLTA